jgi:hypothetical protein
LFVPVGDRDGDGAMDFAELDGDRLVVRTAAGTELELVDEVHDSTECDARVLDFDGDEHVDLLVTDVHMASPEWIPWRWMCPRKSRVTVWSGAWLNRELAR